MKAKRDRIIAVRVGQETYKELANTAKERGTKIPSVARLILEQATAKGVEAKGVEVATAPAQISREDRVSAWEKELAELKTINSSDLTNSERITNSIRLAQLGVFLHFSGPKTPKGSLTT